MEESGGIEPRAFHNTHGFQGRFVSVDGTLLGGLDENRTRLMQFCRLPLTPVSL